MPITTVKELMTDVVETLRVGDTLATARQRIALGRIRHLPVVDGEERLVGLITHRRILEAWVSHGHPNEESVADVASTVPVEMLMDKDVLTVDPETSAARAAGLLEAYKFGCLPVVDRGKLVGIVTEADFVRFAKRFFEWEMHAGRDAEPSGTDAAWSSGHDHHPLRDRFLACRRPRPDRRRQAGGRPAHAARARSRAAHPRVAAVRGPLQAGGRRASTNAAATELAQRARALADQSIDVAQTLLTGPIEEAIVNRAAAIGADLIVVGTHGRQGVARIFLGSVAERVIRAAKCPVLAVPPVGEIRLAAWTPSARPLRITAAVDGTAASDAALDWLRRLRQQVKYDLRLVHLYWPPREHERLGLDPCDPYQPDPEAMAILTRELEGRIARHLGTTETPLYLRALWGAEDDALAWQADTDEADLLVVGTSQGRHGSTAIATVRSSRVPVVCVPGPSAADAPRLHALEPVTDVLVTTDFSTLGNAAIPQAYRLLLRGRGTVTLLHVAEPTQFGLSEDRRSEIETCLLGLVPRGVNAHAIRTRTLVVESDAPAEAIVKAARRVAPDLVVMSSHGRSGLGRALRGSVTEQVLHAAPMPVVVVPPPERAQA